MERLLVVVCAVAVAASAEAQAPPQIPHAIDGYVVTRQENNCLECHDRPREIGKKRAKSQPAPAPASHYGKPEGKPAIAGGHYVCTSCHVGR
jgi:cytochrome c-type protein NapB